MKFLKYTLVFLISIFLLLISIYYLDVKINDPEIPVTDIKYELHQEDINQFRYGPNWLRKNNMGTWEMYLEGSSYELGIAYGALAGDLIAEKEEAFIGEIRNRIPSESYLNFLKYVVGWMNRDLDDYIPKEQLLEIYASSQKMGDSFDFVAPKFHRALNYHAAHDIGHAMQNMNLVGCTSFATWNDRSEENKLLIGRNFDFYFGQEFAKDKIIAFYKPDTGYRFMSVTWAGFTGVVSGMNEKGLTVTLNSAKSGVPTKGKTPVSVIARQILQYASTIQEAYDIAQSYESFVSETFLIGSKFDGRVGLIEKSPEKTALHFSDKNEMIITNHFQSKELFNDPDNQDYLKEGVSDYRYDRVQELLDSLAPMNHEEVAEVLRNKQGLNDKNIGLGNEKAINQLIAHHSIIFSPEDLIVWISNPPYILGEYVAYDLNKIFAEGFNGQAYTDSLNIPADPFLDNEEFEKFTFFAEIRDRLQHYLFTGKGGNLTDSEVKRFVNSNPDGYLTYYYLGDYFVSIEEWAKAKKYLEEGLTKEIARNSEKKHMQEALKECNDNLAK